MSLGGSSNSSSSTASSNSVGFNQSQTYLAPNQATNQQNLVNQFNQAMQNQPGYNGLTNQFLGTQNRLTNMAPTAGMQQLNQFAQQGNPYLQQSIDQFGQNLSDQFGRNIQQIGGAAQLAGQRGSSRQGIAEGLAFEEMLNQYSQGVTGLQSQAYGQQQAAAGQYAALEAQQRAQAAQAAQQGLMGVGQAQAQYFNPFMIGAEVIGAPSILSNAFGYDQSQSEAKSKGQGSGFEIGFGGIGGGTKG